MNWKGTREFSVVAYCRKWI